MRYVQSHSRKQFQPDPVTWTDPKDANKDTEEAANEDYNIGDQMMNLDVLDGYADDISFEIDTGSEGMSEEEYNRRPNPPAQISPPPSDLEGADLWDPAWGHGTQPGPVWPGRVRGLYGLPAMAAITQDSCSFSPGASKVDHEFDHIKVEQDFQLA